jgi:hypothetical protein
MPTIEWQINKKDLRIDASPPIFLYIKNKILQLYDEILVIKNVCGYSRNPGNSAFV